MFIRQSKDSIEVINLALCNHIQTSRDTNSAFPFKIYFTLSYPDDGYHYFKFQDEAERDRVFKNICQLIGVVDIGA